MKTFLGILLNILLLLSIKAQETKKIYYNEAINNISLEDQQKPLVFIDFWATWCAPCISSMPHTMELQKQWGDKIAFVYLSNEPSFKIENFLKRKNYNFHALIDNQRKTETEFNVNSIPNSFLLNPQGEIVWRGKPTEINSSLLQRFAEAYGNEKGETSRFSYSGNPQETQEKWNEFSCSKTKLYFYEDPQVENLFYQDGDRFFLSGDIKYIVSFINDYPLDRITSQIPEKRIRFKAGLEDRELFKKMIRKYLKKNHHYKIEKTENTRDVYYVYDGSNQEFLDNHVYNYERGDAQFIQNDFSIKIDNATPKQVFIILNNITPLTFIYKGKNKNVYDWNIMYNPPENLLNQLQDELNFTIEKKQKKVADYKILSD